MTKIVTMTAKEADFLYEAASQAFLRWNWPDNVEERDAMKKALSKFRRATTLVIEQETDND
jgi:ferritin